MKVILLLLIWNTQGNGQTMISEKFEMRDHEHCQNEGNRQVEILKSAEWDYVGFTCVEEAK